MSHYMDTAPATFRDQEQWIDRLKRGDEIAWELLIARYAGDLRTAIGQMLRKRDLSIEFQDDIEQETWRTAVHKMGTFVYQSEDKLAHWLHSIARHHVQTYMRTDRQQSPSMEDIQSKNLENEFTLDMFLYANGLISHSAEDEVLLFEQVAILEDVLSDLKLRDREILLASLLDNSDRSELAQRYQLEEDTISMIVWRCKGKLRGMLKARLDRGGRKQ
ncbi:MAG: sigma-70 family RNA polymerase sigma factor [Anaerolineae bacterium]|nr:sigma-70 family RNA polymerase sigma factor [Anaerolineae bacterium]